MAEDTVRALGDVELLAAQPFGHRLGILHMAFDADRERLEAFASTLTNAESGDTAM